jgi:hypothetical protein
LIRSAVVEPNILRVLCGGAAQGVAAARAESFRAETGCEIHGEFGAVGKGGREFFLGIKRR